MNNGQLNPKTWLDAIDDLWNGHNLDGVMDTFTDDAVVKFVPPPPGAPEVATGKAQIRSIIASLLPGFRVQSTNHRLAGDRVTWIATASNDAFRSIGVDSVDASGEAALSGERIRAFTITFTPETLARLQAAMASATVS
jgi:hypothetical protein